MKKSYFMIAIIVITGLANTILSRTLDILPIFQFLLVIPFYIMLLAFYRKTRYITIFSILTIISLFGYYMNLTYLGQMGMVEPTMRFFGSLSFFGGLLAFVVAFLIILQHKTYKFIEVTILTLSLVNYVFFSYFNFYFINMLVTIFGPYEVHIETMFTIYSVVVILIELAVMITQSININYLEKNKRYELRMLLKDRKTGNDRFTLD